MKIQSYDIQQDSMHKLGKSRDALGKMTVWASGAQPASDEPSYILDINQSTWEYAAEKAGKTSEDSAGDISDTKTETKLRLIEALVYQMTGKHIKLQVKQPNLDSSGQDIQPDKGMNPVQERDGWGLLYEYQEAVQENESIRYSSGGTVTTSDGKTITFSLEFNMSRSYYQENSLNIRMGDAAKVDPLVVVMDGSMPVLSRNKKDFDLNGDGKTEQIPFAMGGSGFLSLDRNKDGIINDGSELFGPQSGDGFAELRAYDLDHNGWIDESDDVFSQLSILSLSENGDKTLVKLADVGIGAIYLQEISTPFEIKDTADEYGDIRSSSFYLRENGKAGTIHHIDLSL
jgi:hypothetical protein